MLCNLARAELQTNSSHQSKQPAYQGLIGKYLFVQKLGRDNDLSISKIHLDPQLSTAALQTMWQLTAQGIHLHFLASHRFGQRHTL